MRKGKKKQMQFPADCGHDVNFIAAARQAGVIEEALRQHGVNVVVSPDLRHEYCWRVTPANQWGDDDDLPDLTPFAAELAVALNVEAVAVRRDHYDTMVATVYEQFEPPRPPCNGPCFVIADNPFAVLDVALRALGVPAPVFGAHSAGVFTLGYVDANVAAAALARLVAAQGLLAHLLDVQECVVKAAEDEPASVMITVVSRKDAAADESAAPAAGGKEGA